MRTDKSKNPDGSEGFYQKPRRRESARFPENLGEEKRG
jgi:hypothetical protein